MQNRKWMWIMALLVSLVVLVSACASPEEPTVMEGEDQPPQTVELPSDEEMMALLEAKVEGGHSTERVLNASYDYEGWIEVIDRMIVNGAQINAEEKELLAVWLSQRNGQ